MQSTPSFDPNALTFPPPPPYQIHSCNPGNLPPLEYPANADQLPALPSPLRLSLLDEWYMLSTHLIPAAYPRITPFIPLPEIPQWTPKKEEFNNSVRYTTDIVMSIRENQSKLETLPPNDRPMWNCVNRYVLRGHHRPSGSGPLSKGVTLFLAHPNGFHKETWEPALQRLIVEHSSHASYQIDEIWAWEAANHGDACLINNANLGGIFDWRDNSRDILHFLLHYLPASASPGPLPTHLTRLSEAETESRRRNGFQDRNMCHIGHSFGGASIIRAAIETPILFERLFLVEAMVCPMDSETPLPTELIFSYVKGAIQRRDGWASRDEAYKSFAATPFFAAWDPASLQVYVDCALYDTPDGKVKLKMPGIHEGICFAEYRATYEGFELLPTLDERIEAHWLVAGKLPPLQSWQRWRTVWKRTANTSHVRILESGHLIPQEAPSSVAKELHKFLSKYGTRQALL